MKPWRKRQSAEAEAEAQKESGLSVQWPRRSRARSSPGVVEGYL